MPKYTLAGCKHRKTSGYGGGRDFTCLMCCQRLTYDGNYQAVPAPAWDGQCLHLTSFLHPIETLGKQANERAHCKNCGCVVEHPPGPGKWTPVQFYGYLIREEIAPSLID
jgi:hypothetical protein